MIWLWTVHISFDEVGRFLRFKRRIIVAFLSTLSRRGSGSREHLKILNNKGRIQGGGAPPPPSQDFLIFLKKRKGFQHSLFNYHLFIIPYRNTVHEYTELSVGNYETDCTWTDSVKAGLQAAATTLSKPVAWPNIIMYSQLSQISSFSL